MEALGLAVIAVVEGETDHLPAILASKHSDLQNVAAKLPPLSVSRSALVRVLKAWRSGHCAAEDVQKWASFVRRGYVSGAFSGAARPIDIAYDAKDEQLIADVVGRFDEIGDLVEGRIDEEEQEEMLRTLQG